MRAPHRPGPARLPHASPLAAEGWARRIGRAVRRGLCGLAGGALVGCASLQAYLPQSLNSEEDGPTMDTVVPLPGPVVAPTLSPQIPLLVVEAPDDLRVLLETHLDLARATRLLDAASIDTGEWARLIGALPEQARALVRTLGYFNPDIHVSTERVPVRSADQGAAQTATEAGDASVPQVRQVLVRVEPGPVARVRNLQLDMLGELAELADAGHDDAVQLRQELNLGWPLPEGAAFQNSAWAEAKTQLIARLRAAGYALASWRRTAVDVEAARNTVRVLAELDSGPQFRAGHIEAEGLALHDVERVRALAGFRTGDALTEARLVTYQETLTKTGLFEQVAVTLDTRSPQPHEATVRVKVKEAARHSASFAVGLTTDAGPHISVEHLYRRVLGWPITARNKISWARTAQTLDTEVSTQRDGAFNRDLVGVTVSRTDDAGQVLLSQRWRLGRAHDTPTHEWLTYMDVERSKECDALAAGGYDCTDLRALTANRNAIWRRLDNVVLPTTGYAFQWQSGAGLSTELQGEHGPFARLYARLIGYQIWGQGWYVQERLELGGVLKRHTLNVPDSQLFRAGGDESVRGYGYRSLAPVNSTTGATQGGTLLLTSSVELARPITLQLPAVWWALFVDAGRAGDSLRELDPAWGYGLGLRWRSPVGPLKLDWAWGRSVGHARLHINIGLAF